jgi:hypothetical protein
MDRLPAECVPFITRQLTFQDDADCNQKAAFLTAQVASQIEADAAGCHDSHLGAAGALRGPDDAAADSLTPTPHLPNRMLSYLAGQIL